VLNNRPPLLVITCCFAAIGIATIASFALVLSRRGSCTSSSHLGLTVTV
jgi:hypothetical protein